MAQGRGVRGLFGGLAGAALVAGGANMAGFAGEGAEARGLSAGV